MYIYSNAIIMVPCKHERLTSGEDEGISTHGRPQ